MSVAVSVTLTGDGNEPAHEPPLQAATVTGAVASCVTVKVAGVEAPNEFDAVTPNDPDALWLTVRL